MAFSTLTITNAGLALLAKVQTGNELAFTRGQMGSGMLTEGQSIAALTALVTPKQDAYVSKHLRLVSDKLTVGLIFNNLALETAYYWREIGLFATDPVEGEILFAYSNAGNDASYIPDKNSGTVSETINLILSISNAADITITIDNTAVTPAWDDLTVNGVVPCSGTGTNTIAVSNPNITGYSDGLKIALYMGISANTGTTTININGFGAKACRVQQPDGLTVSLTGGETAGITLWQYKAYGDSFVKLGERLLTISDTTAPTENTGLLAKVLNWLANMIKQITGKSSWRTAPAISLEDTKTRLDASTIPYAATTHTGNAYSVTIAPAITSLVDGQPVAVKIDADSTGAATLNVCALGAHALVTADGDAIADLKSGSIYTFRYNSVSGNFILQAKGGMKISGAVDMTAIANGAIAKNDSLVFGGVANLSKIANPASLPGSEGSKVDLCVFGSDLYMAEAISVSPYIITYKLVSGAWSKIADPATPPTGPTSGISIKVYSGDLYLAVMHQTSPYVTTYKLVSGAWSKIANPTTLPPSNLSCGTLGVCDAGLYLVVGFAVATSPYIYSYKLVSGSWSKLADPDQLTSSTVGTLSLCVYGSTLYMAACTSLADGYLYALVSDVWKYVTAVTNCNAVYLTAYGSELFLARGLTASPYLSISKLIKTTWASITQPTSLPTGTVYDISMFVYCGELYVTVAWNASPYISIYKYSSGTWTKIADPVTVPTGSGRGAALTAFNSLLYLAVAHVTTPFITTYNSDFRVATLGSSGGLPYSSSPFTAIAKAAAADGATVSISKLRS